MGCVVMTSISMQANGNGIHTIAVGCPTNNGPSFFILVLLWHVKLPIIAVYELPIGGISYLER